MRIEAKADHAVCVDVRVADKTITPTVGQGRCGLPDALRIETVCLVKERSFAENSVDLVRFGLVGVAQRKQVRFDRHHGVARQGALVVGPEDGLRPNNDDLAFTKDVSRGAKEMLQVFTKLGGWGLAPCSGGNVAVGYPEAGASPAQNVDGSGGTGTTRVLALRCLFGDAKHGADRRSPTTIDSPPVPSLAERVACDRPAHSSRTTAFRASLEVVRRTDR